MTTSKLRRDLAEITRLVGAPGTCRTCVNVLYIGMPRLFVYLYTPNGGPHGWDTGGGLHSVGDLEEYDRFFDGCPDCGEPVKTVPMIMAGMRPDGTRGKPEVPDPWPVNQWPPLMGTE